MHAIEWYSRYFFLSWHLLSNGEYVLKVTYVRTLQKKRVEEFILFPVKYIFLNIFELFAICSVHLIDYLIRRHELVRAIQRSEWKITFRLPPYTSKILLSSIFCHLAVIILTGGERHLYFCFHLKGLLHNTWASESSKTWNKLNMSYQICNKHIITQHVTFGCFLLVLSRFFTQ